MAELVKKANAQEVASRPTRQDFSKIGQMIREIRKSRDVTLTELSTSIGRSIGFMSGIERGLTEPALKDIYAVADYFQVPVSWFLDIAEGSTTGEDYYIVRADRRRWMDSDGIRIEILSTRLGEGLELMVSTYQPLAKTKDLPMGKAGKESAVLIAGTLELWIDGQKFILNEGDSYSLDLSQAFHTRNPSETDEAVLYWAIS